MSKRGLPVGLQMRHDAHYVEELSQQRPTPVGRLISVDSIDPNPEQPRVEIGDLSELTASVKDKGVLEPLLVKPSKLNGRWMIIAGERRWRAAKAAGIREVPCIELDVDDQAVAEIALIENMQRKDLTAWEEADGLLALCERFGYTHEDVARRVGKSRSTVTESLSIASLPLPIREQCRRADISSKSLLLQIVRQPTEEAMIAFTQKVITRGLTRDGARHERQSMAQKGGKAARQPFSFRYVSPAKDFRLELKFRRQCVERRHIAETLRAVAAALESEPVNPPASDND
ncbi:MAG: ParB/RepB/Spo0J family partition protein [Pyrinomonadaceae bacterium]